MAIIYNFISTASISIFSIGCEYKLASINVFVSDIILKVRPLVYNEVASVRDEGTLVSFLYPAQNQDLIKQLAAKKVNAFGEKKKNIK